MERLAWRLTGSGAAAIDPRQLRDDFEQEIANLQLLSDNFQNKITSLQSQCQEEEEDFYGALERLQVPNHSATRTLPKPMIQGVPNIQSSPRDSWSGSNVILGCRMRTGGGSRS